VGGVIGCTTFSEETLEALVDGANGNGGGWHNGASTMDGYDGRGGADGWPTSASIEDASNKKDIGGGRRSTPTSCTSDGITLDLEIGNPKSLVSFLETELGL
jgi:hypothetical protein